MGFAEIEKMGKRVFEQLPALKRMLKRMYQWLSCLASEDKNPVEGSAFRITPQDEYEYFFGYYDKSPWDATDRYMLCIRALSTYREVAPKESAEIVLIDTAQDNAIVILGKTYAWNVQQGCMLQWLGPDFSERIIYNDFREHNLCSVIYNIFTMQEEIVIPASVYAVSSDGSFALTLDFFRLHRLRKGYGYSNLKDETARDNCPDSPCIWRVDLKTGEVAPLLHYTDFAAFEHRAEMDGAIHKVNHIMLNPLGTRFMVLHRWFLHGRKYSRLVTCSMDGADMYNLSDEAFVSHCCWKNDDEVLGFLRKKGQDGYYLVKDRTHEYRHLWPELKTDGHCSYSPDRRLIITDTYPNRKRQASVYLCMDEGEKGSKERIIRVFSPFRYDNDTRCDLHPRWNRKSDVVCIDSVHEGKRKLYTIPVYMEPICICDAAEPMASVIVPCYNTVRTLPRTLESLENQTYSNFEVIIVNDGSTDELQNLIKYIQQSSKLNIIYVTQDNQGVSAARNHGLKLARGKYVCFLDGDDVYHRRFLEQTIGICETHRCDTVLTYQSRDITNTMQDTAIETLIPKVVPSSEVMNLFMYEKESIHFGGLLYRRDIIEKNGLLFTVGAKYGEDLEYALKYITHCINGVILKNKMYGYYNNPDSAVNTVKWEKTNLVEAMLRVQRYLNEKGKAYEEAFANYMLPRTIWTTAKTFAVGNRKDLYNDFIHQYPVKDYIKKLKKSARNKLLKVSSAILCLNTQLFYILIQVAYRKKGI